jgi:hypothetical protein
MSDDQPQELTVLQAAMVDRAPARQRWLINTLWSHQAVGVIGGPPKCCKTWLGLDIAVSVASGTHCLGRFAVEQRGTVLVYLAEDSMPAVRQRIDSITGHRRLDLAALDLYLVDAPRLRLDDLDDRRRLQATLSRLQPTLLLLDPLVRLHRMDENSSADISRLLGFLRELQRDFGLAIALVHHMAKRSNAQPGQALRGSGDIHAWADSSAYLLRKNDHLQLVIEHRAASAPDPLALELATEIHDRHDASMPLTDAIIRALSEATHPLTRTVLRAQLRVNNQRLGDALAALEQCSLVERTSDGWRRPSKAVSTSTDDDHQLTLI